MSRPKLDLIASPAYVVMSARDKFEHPTRRISELWQTDFTYMKVVGWGWYYLTTVLDEFTIYPLLAALHDRGSR